MKKRVIAFALVLILSLAVFTGCGQKKATWTVTCPWAPSGVAAMVNQKTATLSTSYSEGIVIVADAIAGDTATLNTWVSSTKATDTKLAFAGEGVFAITSTLDPDKLQFSYDDFEFVENLYSSIFVLSANSNLNINNLEDLKTYLEAGDTVSVATNGATGSEAFLVAALFGSMGYSNQLKVVAYSSAAEAAQAVAKGETDLAVSHQSQILENFNQNTVTVVCAFDGEDIKDGPFAGVEGVGKKGYPYFRNRCFVLARKGASAEKISELKKLYGSILADTEMSTWLNETMLLEVDTLTAQQAEEHIANVKSIVEEYKDVLLS